VEYTDRLCDTFRKALIPAVAKKLKWDKMPEDARQTYRQAMLATMIFIHESEMPIEAIIGGLTIATAREIEEVET
jgi:hypothetical protein